MADAHDRRLAPLRTPTSLSEEATRDISAALTGLLADVFALYLKTKNFHWHVSGPHFRDFHLLLDGQAAELFAMTDPIAERARKIGGVTLRSIGQIAGEVREAQIARGRRPSPLTLVVPVIVRLLKMADEITDAIDARS